MTVMALEDAWVSYLDADRTTAVMLKLPVLTIWWMTADPTLPRG